MTFTSIPPSLRPVVEDVAEALATNRDYMLNESRLVLSWMFEDAEAAILAFLNACVERKIGRVSDVKARNSERVVATRLILNLGATDDTA